MRQTGAKRPFRFAIGDRGSLWIMRCHFATVSSSEKLLRENQLNRMFCLLAVAATAVGCLTTPEPVGPNGTPDSDATSNNDNNDSDADSEDTGVDDQDRVDMSEDATVEDGDRVADRRCGECSAVFDRETGSGDAECVTHDGGQLSHRVCVAAEGADGPDERCLVWAEPDLCAAGEECAETTGCGCLDECEVGADAICSIDGVFVCVEVGGCNKLIDISRGPDCADLPHDCEALIELQEEDESIVIPGYCRPCVDDEGASVNGRSCAQACADESSGYVCGQVGGSAGSGG